MYQLCDAGRSRRVSHAPELQPPALRTYRQIARILAKQEGTTVTAAHVRRMCRAAEIKLASALLSDPVLHAWLSCGVAAEH